MGTFLIIFFALVIAIIAKAGYDDNVRKAKAKILTDTYGALSEKSPLLKSFAEPDGLCFIGIDTDKNVLLIAGPAPKESRNLIWHRYIKFSDILKTEVLVDDQMVSSKSAGRAVAGGVLFGTTGAVVGGTSGKTTYSKEVKSVRLKILVNDIGNPSVELPFFIERPGKKYSNQAAICQHWQDTITVATH